MRASDIQQKVDNIRLLILDVDGVLTNGTVAFLTNGEEIKFFNVQDGVGIKAIRSKGWEVAAISGRKSQMVQLRLEELGVKHIYQGQENKLLAFEQLLFTFKIKPEQCAYVGDDLPDLPLLKRVGLAIAVNNAVEAVKSICHWKTARNGGEGAVREVCDLLLMTKQ